MHARLVFEIAGRYNIAMVVRTWLRRTAVYFGLRDRDDVERPSIGLEFLCRSLLTTGAEAAFLALVAAAAVVGVFAWSLAALANGAIVAVVSFCSVYLTAVR